MKRLKNDGSALIVATVAGVVVMTFSLMLLLVAYSLFSTVNGQKMDIKCRELSQSIADEVVHEICDVNYDDYATMMAANSAGADRLWFFVRCNVWQDFASWPYYNEDEAPTGHGINSSAKYFKIDMDDICDDVSIRMNWSKEKDDKVNTKLIVYVTVTNNGVVYGTKRTLELDIDKYDDVAGDGNVTLSGNDINPNGNSIVMSEKWSWNLYD